MIRNLSYIRSGYSLAIACALHAMHATSVVASTGNGNNRLVDLLSGKPLPAVPNIARSYAGSPHKARIQVSSFSPSRPRGLSSGARRRGKVSRKRGH